VKITWEEFLETFSKRGKLRANEHIIFGPPLKSREEALAETQRTEMEDPENKHFRLLRQLKEKMVGKQNFYVPKDGKINGRAPKGKYNLTVPEPPRFLKQKQHNKTIRQQRLEKDAFER
jgi:hypothetical protein